MAEMPSEWRARVSSEIWEFCRQAEREFTERGLRILSRLQFTAVKPTIVLVLACESAEGARVRGSAIIQKSGELLEIRASRAIRAFRREKFSSEKNQAAVSQFEAALEKFFTSIQSIQSFQDFKPRTSAA